MAALIALTLFAVLMAVTCVYGYRRFAKPARYYEHLGVSEGLEEPAAISVAAPEQPSRVRIFEQIGELVPVSPDDASLARRYLIAAGYRSDTAVKVYYGVKVVACVLMLLAAIFFRGALVSSGVLRTVLLVAAPVAGYFLPNFILERLLKKRHERLRLGLPDALDLMVVAVESGSGLDQAVQTVSKRLARAHKDISDEFALVNLEMRAGTRRADATLRELVGILIQADRFGTSMADSLRTHSDYMRVKRRQEAEERAAKVGVKLIFPIFFFILPSILVVAAGPALLQVFKQLLPMLRQVN
jgi:tight adherence protein C